MSQREEPGRACSRTSRDTGSSVGESATQSERAMLGAQLIRVRIKALEALERRVEKVAIMVQELIFETEDLIHDVRLDIQQAAETAAANSAPIEISIVCCRLSDSHQQHLRASHAVEQRSQCVFA